MRVVSQCANIIIIPVVSRLENSCEGACRHRGGNLPKRDKF